MASASEQASMPAVTQGEMSLDQISCRLPAYVWAPSRGRAETDTPLVILAGRPAGLRTVPVGAGADN